MKKLLIVIIVLIVIAVATPFFIGNTAEKDFRKLYSDMNVGPSISFEVTDYNKGWFNSTAEVEVSINLEEFQGKPVQRLIASLQHNIQHGPVLSQTRGMGIGILDVDMKIEVPADLTENPDELNDILNNVVTFATRVGMDGSVDTIMDINEYQYTKDGNELNIKPGQMEFVVNNNQDLTVAGEWTGMNIKARGRDAMLMGTMTVSAELAPLDKQQFAMSGLFTGSTSVEMSEMVIYGENPMQALKLTNIAMTSENTIADEAMSVKVDMGVDSLDFFGMVFTDFVFKQELNSLNIPALQKINTMANQINTGQMNEAEMTILQEAVMELLENQPEVIISKLGLTTDQGEITTNAKVSINSQLIDENNPESLVNAMEMSATGAIPEAFLNSMGIMPMLKPYVTEGFLEIESGEVRFDMVYEGGEMMMFGKPFNWAALAN